MQEAFLEAVRAVSQDQLFNACGTVGGLLLAGAQIPQIYYVTTRQRARDVSYAYQFTFAIGMVMFLVYYGYHHRWSVFVPSCLSFACVCYLIGLKTYLDVMKPKRTAAAGGLDDGLGGAGDGAGLGRLLLGAEAEAEEDEFIAYPAPVR